MSGIHVHQNVGQRKVVVQPTWLSALASGNDQQSFRVNAPINLVHIDRYSLGLTALNRPKVDYIC